MTKQYWHQALTRNCVWLFQMVLSDGEVITERVFLTSAEAKLYGKSRPYAHGKENKNWRIWGVPCEGLMAEILGENLNKFVKEIEPQ